VPETTEELALIVLLKRASLIERRLARRLNAQSKKKKNLQESQTRGPLGQVHWKGKRAIM
jgi:hypothetical protein